MARSKEAGAVASGRITRSQTSRAQPSSGTTPGPASNDAKSSTQKPTTTRKNMPSNGVQKAGARRGAARTAKKDRWGEEFLATNPKSPIVNVDLVKLLAHPKAWTCLDEDDKKEILDLLPDHIRPAPPADDPEGPIPPISPGFLRYSNNWRDGVRQYQYDLEQGKYDPKWLSQAAEAMEERANGKFDKWKEEQFEQFWGQKQKLDHDVIAGASSKIKLETLIKHGCIQVGDVWKYSRAFGKGSGALLVEKEVKVIEADGSSLTFAIPPGQRAFLRGTYDQKTQGLEVTKEIASTVVDASDKVLGHNGAAGVDLGMLSTIPDSALPESSAPSMGDNRGSTDYKQNGMVDLGILSTIPDSTISESSAAAHETDPSASEPMPTETDAKSGENEPQPIDMDAHGDDEAISAATNNEAVHHSGNNTDGVENPSNTGESAGALSPMASSPPLRHMGADSATGSTAMADNATYMDATKKTQVLGSEVAQGISVEGPGEIKQSLPVTKDRDGTLESAEMTPASGPETPAVKATNNEELTDIILPNVTGPQPLVNKILKIDARVADPPNGNAWKEIRCRRNNQDIGSLWEIRQEWFVRNKQ